MTATREVTCSYGENAWQSPAKVIFTDTGDPLGLFHMNLIEGEEPSANNWIDLERLLQTTTHVAAGFDKNFADVPCIAICVKHGNACGAAVAGNALDAVVKMVTGNIKSIFGGLVMVNFEIDDVLAEALLRHESDGVKRLLNCVAAPSFTDGAIKLLRRKNGMCRLIINPELETIGLDSLDAAPRERYLRGAKLVQPNYTYVLDLKEDVDTTPAQVITPFQAENAVLAWAIGSTSNSNTITLTREGMLIGNGVGQQDRVECCELAIKRATEAGHSTAGAVAYSDSFFPFPDGPEKLADAGVSVILTSSGSIKDRDTMQVCAKDQIALLMVPDKIGRGFFGH